jgi:polyhydroxybutyrate depolymerase
MRKAILIIAGVAVLLLVVIAAGVYWAIGPAIRCQLPDDGLVEDGWSGRVITSGGRDRCYYLYLPKGHDPTERLPLVVSFHGFMSNPESHALITRWHKLADQEGFVVVYPEGTQFPQRWQSGDTWGAEDVDDVQFFLDTLEDVQRVAAVDSSRVYVNGFSNGGGMTVKLGCEAADQIAAMGTVAAAVLSREDCQPSRPMPAIAFHGTEDPVVRYEGEDIELDALKRAAKATNVPSRFVGAPEWTRAWAALNLCDTEPVAMPQQGDVRGVSYTGCEQDADVILHTVEGGGHTWPGGMPIPVVGRTTRDISATEEMWRFYQRYQLEDGTP